MQIKTVTVIGVTGNMGANVAGIFASFGDAKVYAVGRDIEKAKSTIPRIIKSIRSDAIKKNIIPADFTMLGKCIAESDLVFESSAEDIEIKKNIHKEISNFLSEDAISCSGTSGLSINELAECYPDNLRGNFFGVHMFNPPYSMSLCELIGTKYSNKELIADLHVYLEKNLYRTVVEVKDSPAFLANRIGFNIINSAIQAADKYKDDGGIDYIDSILGPFTGRNMAPIETANFVGLDVHKAIVNNIYDNSFDYAHDDFKIPCYVEKLIASGYLGKKQGAGFYKFDSDTYQRKVWDIKTNEYRDVIDYKFTFAEKMKAAIADGDYLEALEILTSDSSKEGKICLDFLLKYIVYSVFIADKLGNSIEYADDVMSEGFNWCPPLSLYQALSSILDVEALIEDRIPEVIGKVNWKELSYKIIPSKYDYRMYFKSR